MGVASRGGGQGRRKRLLHNVECAGVGARRERVRNCKVVDLQEKEKFGKVKCDWQAKPPFSDSHHRRVWRGPARHPLSCTLAYQYQSCKMHWDSSVSVPDSPGEL